MSDPNADDGTIAGLPLRTAPGAAALADRLAADVAASLRAALETRGQASLVVSGGSTPAAMFDRLAHEALDWSRVGVTLADERAVPPDHEDSNERLVRTRLLVDEAAAARFTPLYRSDGDLARVGAALDALARPFDVVLLGMGTDGHTASLFPDAPELEAALAGDEAVMGIVPPSTPHPRITLTRRALLDARRCVLHVVGAAKRDVLEAAMAAWREGGDAPGTPPVARALGAASEAPGVAVEVWWAP